MKKLALILMTVVYMLSTLGVAVSQFYCCGKLASKSISLFNGKQKNTPNDDSGCCKTTNQYLKIKDAHIFSDHISSPEKYFSVIQTTFPVFVLIASEKQQAAIANNINAPPLLTETPIYIFNCTYRI